MMHEYHARQDGADFYLTEGSALIAVIAYPDRVRDFDIEAAKKARDWFNNLMRMWGIRVYFSERVA